MTTPVSATVSFSFAEDNANSSQSLSVENWNGFVGMGSVSLSLIDTITAGTLMLYASVGEVIDFNMTASKTINPSFVQVDGDNSASVPDEAGYEVLFALDENGSPMGTPGEVSRFDGKVTFSQKFWGLIKVKEYQKTFKVLKYTPKKEGLLWTYGVVAAYKNGQLAICHVEPIQSGTGNDELEIYRVESQVLLNKDGEWEMPSGWPDNPTYPNGATPPRPRIGVVSTRVHEVGMVTASGYFYSRAFDIETQKPYFGDTSYKPKTTVVQGSGFSKLTPAMQVKAKEAIAARGKGSYI